MIVYGLSLGCLLALYGQKAHNMNNLSGAPFSRESLVLELSCVTPLTTAIDSIALALFLIVVFLIALTLLFSSGIPAARDRRAFVVQKTASCKTWCLHGRTGCWRTNIWQRKRYHWWDVLFFFSKPFQEDLGCSTIFLKDSGHLERTS